MSWNKNFNGTNHFNNKKIDVINIPAKLAISLIRENGDIKILNAGKVDQFASKNESTKYINNDEIITLPRGLHKGGYPDVKYWNGEFINSMSNYVSKSNNINKIRTKFIYYFLRNNIDLLGDNYRGSGIRMPDMKSILKIKIPVPPIRTQDKIINILDQFDTLANSISEGIPAEINLREQQYEYYRNKLLTFEEMEEDGKI
ncbi:MAG: restriction endonuclease subunit S [Mycoplasmoidaceae bacterium]